MKKKEIIIITTIILSIGVTGVVVSKVKERVKYDSLILKASVEFEANNYDEAKALYIESKKIKELPEVNSRLEAIEDIEIQEKNIEDANLLYNEGNLEEAISKLDLTNDGISEELNSMSKTLREDINRAIKDKKEAERIAEEERKYKEEAERIKAEEEQRRIEEEKRKAEEEKNKVEEDQGNNQSTLKTYYYKTNISEHERGEKPSFPYITYGEAENNIAKAYFKRHPEHSGENLFMYITPIDGSFYGNIFFNGNYSRTYELNAITGEIVTDIKHDEHPTDYPEEIPINNGSIKF